MRGKTGARLLAFGLFSGLFALSLTASREARADERFATPPPNAQIAPIAPIRIEPTQPPYEHYDYVPPPSHEAYRSPLRFELGPTFVTTGQGMGYGLTGGLSIGTGTIGGRFSATFLRGEGGDNNVNNAPTGASMAQYLGEIVLDLRKRGTIHPVVAMGMGLVHVDKGTSSGDAGVGTARGGVEYSFGVDDADVRIGASVTGALIGPQSSEVSDLKAYALFDVHVSLGF